MGWSEGDVVCLRQVWRERVWQAHAWYVVDDPGVLFAPVGAEAWFPDHPIPRDDWVLRRSPFQSHLLRLVHPGDGHSTLLEWDATWTFVEWYVNFERQQQPTPLGFDYVDRALDLVCYPDGRWELLDEDELQEALERGVLTAADAAEARADAERIVADWPFPTGWEDWRPDPEWPAPTLPEGWDRVG
ncbi:MAG TPA: DUF402 domain-containing protein [Gaiellaceae bacterium]|nr:DUF402 domain-containing protein [Gaiellaceae bacterium]